MASRPRPKHPVMMVDSFGLQSISEGSEVVFSTSMADVGSAESTYIKDPGSHDRTSTVDTSMNSANGVRIPTGRTLPKNILGSGVVEPLPSLKSSSGPSKASENMDFQGPSLSENNPHTEQKQDPGRKGQASPQPVIRTSSAHRSGGALVTPAARDGWKGLRSTWKNLPDYYNVNRQASTCVEVSRNTPSRLPYSARDDALPTPPPPEDTEHIPVGDHWGSLKHAGMSIHRALTDPEFASKWKMEQEKPTGFMSIIQTLFNQVQEAAWPCPVQDASMTRRLLITISIMGRVGALRLWVTKETCVKDAIALALLAYAKEGRFPALGLDTNNFELYLSPYTTSALDMDEKIWDTGARSFVLWGPGLAGTVHSRHSTSCAQEHSSLNPLTYTSLHLYDSGSESPHEESTLAKLRHQSVIPGLPWLPSTLMRCIPV